MRKLLVLVALACVVGLSYVYDQHDDGSTSQQSGVHASHNKTEAFNTSAYSQTDPASPWVIVNKQRQLNPAQYAPNDLITPNVALRLNNSNASMQLRKQTAQAIEKLFAAASANGTPLRLSSGYRSYDYQVTVYGHYVNTEGQSAADAESARPGYSEHQTGWAADVGPLSGACNVEQCFGNTPAGQWLAANAYRYGFIIRYPANKTTVTGYEYEPWHIRYVGTGLAAEMHKQNALTLEEFFNTGAAADY